MPLDEDSSFLTTFNTPFGRYRFTVVPFGVVFAQEVFHKTVHDQFRDIPGCETDIDDIDACRTNNEKAVDEVVAGEIVSNYLFLGEIVIENVESHPWEATLRLNGRYFVATIDLFQFCQLLPKFSRN